MPNIIQVRRTLLRPPPVAAAAGFTPTSTESSDFLARATTIADDADKTIYDALISGLVADGDFSTLDGLYIWRQDRTAALLNLRQNAYNLTEHGTVSFSSSLGYTGNGTDFYLDTGFNPFSASSPQYTKDSASVGVYVQSNITSGTSGGYVLGADSTGTLHLAPFYSGNSIYAINGDNKSVSSSTSQGLWVLTRTASNAFALYRNGSTTAVDTDTSASDFLPHANIFFFAENSGGANLPSAAQMSAGFIGSGLTSAAMARIAARINTFMTAYGINVY